MLDRLGRVISRHPWSVCGCCGWRAFLLAVYGGARSAGSAQGLFDRLSTGGGTRARAGEGRARTCSQPDRDDGPIVLLLVDDVAVTVEAAAAAARRRRAAATSRRIPNVVATADPFARNTFIYDADSIPYIADDQNAVLMTGDAAARPGAGGAGRDDRPRSSDRLRRGRARACPGSRAIVGGLETIVEEVTAPGRGRPAHRRGHRPAGQPA